MKILVLAWEFPPRIVGGIARHVAELYPEIAQSGHEVHLLTVEFGQAPHYEVVDNIKVHRVPVGASQDFFHWVGNMNESMGRHGGKLLLEEEPFDLIHAHDWLVGDAAIALKHTFKVPLVTTIHATEFGRHNGLHNPIHHYIHQKEKYLAHESWRVIVCSDYMRREVERALCTPWDKVDVVFNGIRSGKKPTLRQADHCQFRRRFAADNQHIVYYVGRMTYEKGVQVLLDATPTIIQELNGQVKVVIIGSGQSEALKRQAWELGIWDHCHFTGFMSEEDLDQFQTIADCAVFPSLYEPFGIVVLESFAARVPVVVSNAGGIPEVVRHGKTGIVTLANNSGSLAAGILMVLQHPYMAKRLVEQAYQELGDRFSWAHLAQQTDAIYQRVIQERQQVLW